MCSLGLFVVFFFFQAEDGIRDRNVTGVQTCALPILPDEFERLRQPSRLRQFMLTSRPAPKPHHRADCDVECPVRLLRNLLRSEERRVGKECRSGWSTEQ